MRLVYSSMWKDNVFVTLTLRHKKCKRCHHTFSTLRITIASVNEQRRMLPKLTPRECMSSSKAKHYIRDHTLYGPWAGIAKSVLRLATGWTIRELNPGGGESFRTRQDRPWGSTQPPIQRVKRPRRGVDHPPPSSAKVKERVELYIHSPFGPSWPVVG